MLSSFIRLSNVTGAGFVRAPKYVCRLLPVPTDKIELKNSFRIRICSRYRRWQEAFKPKIKEFCRAFCDSLERANCFAFGARHGDKRKMENILSDNIAFLNSVSLKIAFLAIARERAKKYNQQHTSAEANIYESSISETRMFEDYARARHTPTRQIRAARHHSEAPNIRYIFSLQESRHPLH